MSELAAIRSIDSCVFIRPLFYTRIFRGDFEWMCDIFTNTDIFLHAKGLADGAPLKQKVKISIYVPALR